MSSTISFSTNIHKSTSGLMPKQERPQVANSATRPHTHWTSATSSLPKPGQEEARSKKQAEAFPTPSPPLNPKNPFRPMDKRQNNKNGNWNFFSKKLTYINVLSNQFFRFNSTPSNNRRIGNCYIMGHSLSNSSPSPLLTPHDESSPGQEMDRYKSFKQLQESPLILPALP